MLYEFKSYVCIVKIESKESGVRVKASTLIIENDINFKYFLNFSRPGRRDTVRLRHGGGPVRIKYYERRTINVFLQKLKIKTRMRLRYTLVK